MVETEGFKTAGLEESDFRKQVEAQTPLGRMRVAPAPSRTVLAQSDVGLDGSLDLPSRMGIVASGIDVLLGVSAPEDVRGTADWVAILGAFPAKPIASAAEGRSLSYQRLLMPVRSLRSLKASGSSGTDSMHDAEPSRWVGRQGPYTTQNELTESLHRYDRVTGHGSRHLLGSGSRQADQYGSGIPRRAPSV
jgi:hypothetical protein